MAAAWYRLYESTGHPKSVIIGTPKFHAPIRGPEELS